MIIPKLSIIVPVYNVERYLRQCIDCILAQTFKDFELLLIDDGSSDNSGKICDEYARKDPRIRVFHKPNGGVCSARNVGLKNAVAEYITFSDSDDWMENKWLSSMLEGMDETDLVVTGHVRHWDDGRIEVLPLEDKIYKRNEYSKICAHLMNIGQMGYLWTMVFKKSIIQNNNVFFNEQMSFQEDLEFILRYLLYTSSFRTLPCCNYHYRLVTGKPYEHLMTGVLSLIDVYEKILNGKALDKYKRDYAQTATLVLLKHCSKYNYDVTKKLLKSCVQEFHGTSIHPIRWVLYHFSYFWGYPMIKAIYFTRIIKLRLLGPAKPEDKNDDDI